MEISFLLTHFLLGQIELAKILILQGLAMIQLMIILKGWQHNSKYNNFVLQEEKVPILEQNIWKFME